VSRTGLLVEVRGFRTPGDISIEHIERKLRAALFDLSAARGKSGRGIGGGGNLRGGAEHKRTRLEATVVDWGSISPICGMDGQHTLGLALSNEMAIAAIEPPHLQPSIRGEARPSAKIVFQTGVGRPDFENLSGRNTVQLSQEQYGQTGSQSQRSGFAADIGHLHCLFDSGRLLFVHH
jgi:hypothetical protein